MLKNAIDWASRPYGDSAWKGKPVAIMGASAGVLGTARAQYHLRQMLRVPRHARGQPARGDDRRRRQPSSTPSGNLTDDMAKKLIGQLLANLCELAKRHGAK